MNKTLKTLTLALALTSLVMALGSQIPTILPVSPVTEKVEFQKGISVDNGFGLQIGPAGRSLKTWWNYCEFVKSATPEEIYSSTTSGTGSGVTGYQLTTPLRIGGWLESTGTTTSGYASINTSPAAFQFSGGVYTFETDIRLYNLSDATNTYAVRVGFGDSTTGAAHTDGAYYYYTDVGGGTPTPNWSRNTVSNSVLTSTDTGVAVVIDEWIRLKIVVNAAGTSVEYFINGVSVGANTTNIPTGTGRELGVAVAITKSAGTANRALLIDWAWLHVDLVTSR